MFPLQVLIAILFQSMVVFHRLQIPKLIRLIRRNMSHPKGEYRLQPIVSAEKS
jgi:hypothetical protein